MSRNRALATLGQLIDVVLHDGRQPVATIVNEALVGREDVEELQKESLDLSHIHKRFQLIEGQGTLLSTVFRRKQFVRLSNQNPKQIHHEI